MTLAVCLLSFNRPKLTDITLRTFCAHNKLDGLMCLHADDCSETSENLYIAKRYGFETVWCPPHHRGNLAACKAMWQVAVDRGATRILHLEHDCETVAPLPVGIETTCVRLYGKLKGRSGPRSQIAKFIKGTDKVIEWKDWKPGWQIGLAHWGGQPSITKSGILIEAAYEAKGEWLSGISKLLVLSTARPTENITWHIG